MGVNMTEYTWTINEVEWHPDTGAIQKAHWECIAIDGDIRDTAAGVCQFEVDPSREFTPLDAVGMSDVLNWCWWTELDRAKIEASLAARIERVKNPPVIKGLPWA